MSVDEFLSIGFINKKVQQYRTRMDSKDLKNLYNLFNNNESSNNNQNKSKKSLNQLCKQRDFLAVAKQVQLLGYDNDYCIAFGIYGMKIENANKDYLIIILERIIEESCFSCRKNQNNLNYLDYKKTKTSGVTLVFFNNSNGKKRLRLQNGKQISQPLKFDDFKNQIIKGLRFKYLSKINQLILLYPSFFNKSFSFLNSFGFRDAFYSKFVTLFESVSQVVTFLGPLFEYGKIDSEFLMKEETEKIKSSVSVDKIAQSKQQFSFYQQFQSPLYNETESLFVYSAEVKNYRSDPRAGIPLLLSVCFKYLIRNHIKFQGLFRKVGDETDLRKLQNRLWSYEGESPFNKHSQQHQAIQIQQKIIRQLSQFPPETITSNYFSLFYSGFVKKVFTNLGNPLLCDQVYQSIVSLSQVQLQSVFTCISQNQSRKDQEFKRMNFTKLQQCVKGQQPRIIIKEKFDVKGKIAFFQNLSQQYTKQLSPQSAFISPTYGLDTNDYKEQNRISFTKIPTSNSFTKKQQQQLKNIDFLQLNEMKNYHSDQYHLLKKTVLFLNKIISERKFNLMSAKNLAICFNPCFFRTQSLSKKDNSRQIQEQLQNQSKLVRVIEKMIEQPKIFEFQ